jgi:transcriptional regulator
MYVPRTNAVTDSEVLFDFMRRFNFATLVTVHEGSPFATHLPFLVYPDRGEHGTLVSHMARANPQWRDFSLGGDAMVVFQGPHAYISPSWYEAHPSVPTWNYMVAHVYGVPKIIEDDAQVREILRSLVDEHERGFAQPWKLEFPESYFQSMIKGIVAFELPIARIEGKFKLSQNRSTTDQERVITALASDADPNAQGVAQAMQRRE